jgi:hypothetical protein
MCWVSIAPSYIGYSSRSSWHAAGTCNPCNLVLCLPSTFWSMHACPANNSGDEEATCNQLVGKRAPGTTRSVWVPALMWHTGNRPMLYSYVYVIRCSY